MVIITHGQLSTETKVRIRLEFGLETEIERGEKGAILMYVSPGGWNMNGRSLAYKMERLLQDVGGALNKEYYIFNERTNVLEHYKQGATLPAKKEVVEA